MTEKPVRFPALDRIARKVPWWLRGVVAAGCGVLGYFILFNPWIGAMLGVIVGFCFIEAVILFLRKPIYLVMVIGTVLIVWWAIRR
jgi:apolipoprotein N-acyltransferase